MYATIRSMVPHLHMGTPTLDQMQAAVDGYICTADRIYLGRGRSADVYCNDEGLLIGMPLTYFRRDGSPIVGDLIVTGADSQGETIPLTMDEVEFALGFIGFEFVSDEPTHEEYAYDEEA